MYVEQASITNQSRDNLLYRSRAIYCGRYAVSLREVKTLLIYLNIKKEILEVWRLSKVGISARHFYAGENGRIEARSFNWELIRTFCLCCMSQHM